MDDQPQTWHYGIIARWWAEFNEAEPAELAFYRGCIERYGQPALDLACGTGRLLVPLLQAGLEVEGCDLSLDMLAYCRAKAEAAGFSPQLYAQAMHALDLPRRYHTIYIVDSFGIGGQRQQDREALRRIYAQLEAGGALVFSHDLPYGNASQWQYWVGEQRNQLPEPWEPSWGGRPAADGDKLELRSRVFALDPLEQRLTLQMLASVWRDGQMVAEEEHTLQTTLYFRNELLLMLEQAGFKDVEVLGGYTGKAATAEDQMVVFIARK